MNFNERIIGIVGLGLIGGSLAKVIKEKKKCRVLGHDAAEGVLSRARGEGVIDGALTKENIAQCDMVIVALYPDEVIAYCKEHFASMRPGCVVVDCAGVKTKICGALSKEARDVKLSFVGGHPMAGVERFGYENSFPSLFDHATMILCKDEYTNKEALSFLEGFFLSLGFGGIKIADAAEHDEVIAYTSQLAHIVSSAFIRSRTMKRRYGFSAGSFKDLTRVARLNENMWAPLFFENRDNLLIELDTFMDSMEKFRNALESSDYEKMRGLLKSGTELKLIDDAEEQKWKGK